MVKIDLTKIEGYDAMTPEQKVAALEAFEYDDHSAELEKQKNALSKANSEAAEWKRKHNALISEDERKKQEHDEELQTLRQQVADMQRANLISGFKAQFLGMGYSDSLAAETAQAMADGNTDKVFANQKLFIETHDQALKTGLLTGMAKPPIGTGTGQRTITLEELRGMSPQERYEFSQKNPEDYKKLYGGN